MAFLKCFTTLRSLPRSFYTSQCKRTRLPSEWDLATGRERWEACQHAKGNKAPFLEVPLIQGPGTKDCPNVVPSFFDKRLVTCICSDYPSLGFYLHEGFPRRCYCNKWFVLERVPFPKIYEDLPDCCVE